ADQQETGAGGNRLLVRPGDLAGPQHAGALRMNRHELVAAGGSGEKDLAVAVDRPARRVHASMNEPPQLLAGRRLVSDGGLGRGRDQFRPALDLDHRGRGVSLLDVAVVRWIVDVAISFPDGLAGGLVQGDKVLQVETVEREDEQVAVQDRRRAGSAVVVARQIAPLPEDRARRGVETGSAGTAEVYVDPA